ncbi:MULTISPECIES: FliA/WhiG family RNA polymerase sigma factor [Rhodobacterales]|jgi:RNA polymerase sigma factor for flagellar operon FliA|uniref:sigma-70 family RNA polymerase sigma factor n=1 Tax=Rhodobacterales TaxID=204455 RepID=UPI00201F05B7|nr:FliA/WhiG family RNA polymerase sigma factor [Marivivens sp.]MCL7405049.1 FliA/WhiG family RNA polymerase sigma factor [Marivivens geojensis]NBQ50529.1 FliA/WhiG family RNA polymerase sigma factor [Marivivens sp.]NBT50525.1 FliA/WhiG family RNA polymerase sigma factor [Marivivens sp.]NCW70063.1 FliA/WhiG family RNA polymerase sigma factor [Marivivens sp.]NDH03393.1 FliA/WhiG family RNA polymerase sigma factor [Marivivens sp.]
MIMTKGYAEQKLSPDKLVADHMHIVRKIAWHMFGRVGRIVEIDDLLQVGYMGLIDASRRYQPKVGASFASYAAIRVRGSIVDFLRDNASVCRSTILMQQKVRAATAKLEQQLMRAPEKEEIAAELSLTVAELEDWQTRFAASQIKSLDELYTDQSNLFSDGARTAEDNIQHNQMKMLLRKALGKLPEREALLLQLYYVQELNVYEIAEVLGVTTGRVSQIKKAAVDRLRKFISEMEEGD